MSLAVPGLPLKAALPLRIVTASRTCQSWQPDSIAQRCAPQRRRISSHTRWRTDASPIARRSRSPPLIQYRVCTLETPSSPSGTDRVFRRHSTHRPHTPHNNPTPTKSSASQKAHRPPISRKPTMASRRSTIPTRTKIPAQRINSQKRNPHTNCSLTRRRRKHTTTMVPPRLAKAELASTPARRALAAILLLVARTRSRALAEQLVDLRADSTLKTCLAHLREARRDGVKVKDVHRSQKNCTWGTTSRYRRIYRSWKLQRV